MDLQELELHDAELLGVRLDPTTRVAEIRLAYYPDPQAGNRSVGTLRFAEVSHFQQIADLVQMQDHAKAGNISYWVTGETPGLSYIFLVRGLIAVAAGAVEFIPGES